MPREQHPVEVHGMDTILEDGLKVEDLEVKDLLLLMYSELKIMNIHFSLLTGSEVTEEDI